jgi:hypothetical protein
MQNGVTVPFKVIEDYASGLHRGSLEPSVENRKGKEVFMLMIGTDSQGNDNLGKKPVKGFFCTMKVAKASAANDVLPERGGQADHGKRWNDWRAKRNRSPVSSNIPLRDMP